MRGKERVSSSSYSIIHTSPFTGHNAKLKRNSLTGSKEISSCQLSSYGYSPAGIIERTYKKTEEPLLNTPSIAKRKNTSSSATTRGSFTCNGGGAGCDDYHQTNLAESWSSPPNGNNPESESMNDPVYFSMGSYNCCNSNVWNVIRSSRGGSVSVPREYLARSRSGSNTTISCAKRFTSPKIVRAVRLESYVHELKVNNRSIVKQKSCVADVNQLEVNRIYRRGEFKRGVGLNIFLDNIGLVSKNKPSETHNSLPQEKVKPSVNSQYLRKTKGIFSIPSNRRTNSQPAGKTRRKAERCGA